MPQAKKRVAKKKAAPKRKAAAKRKPAAQTPQVNRMTTTEETRPDDAEQTDEQRQAEAYQPRRRTLQNADLDQHAAEEERQAELAAEREEHNIRTGDASRASWA